MSSSPSDSPRPATLDYPAAAEYIGCSVRALKRLVADGMVRHVPISPRMVRLRPDDLDAYLDTAARGGFTRPRR
jgi:excisionase family DNA binding protein